MESVEAMNIYERHLYLAWFMPKKTHTQKRDRWSLRKTQTPVQMLHEKLIYPEMVLKKGLNFKCIILLSLEKQRCGKPSIYISLNPYIKF